MSSAGFLSSLPHLARLLCAFGFGSIADLIRRRNWLSVTLMRKVFCLPCKHDIYITFNKMFILVFIISASSHHSWYFINYFGIFRQRSLCLCGDYDNFIGIQWSCNCNKFTKFTRFGTKLCRNIVWYYQLYRHNTGNIFTHDCS